MTPQDRIEQLEEQVAYLKSELGVSLRLTDQARIMERFSLSPKAAKILMALRTSNGRLLSHDFLVETFAPESERDKIIDVYICKIRKAIGRDSVKTCWGEGFSLTEAGKTRVDQALTAPIPHYNQAKQYCKHGHPLWGNNLYLNKRGQRQCHQCQKDRDRAYRRKKRALESADLTSQPANSNH